MPTWAALTSLKHLETLSLMQRTERKELGLPDYGDIRGVLYMVLWQPWG